MLTRLQTYLIGALLLQIIIGVYVFWPAADTAQAGTPLLDIPVSGQVDRLEIEGSNGQRIELSIDPTTNFWVHAPSGYPANDIVINQLVASLAQVETGRLVTQTPASHGSLQVADQQFNQIIRVWNDGVRQELIVGTAPNARSVHVRVPDQDEVWLTAALTSRDVDPDLRNWVDTLYYSIERNDVLGMTVENGNGTFEFVQTEPAGEDEEGNFKAAVWALKDMPEDARFDATAFNTLLSRATSIRFSEPLGVEQKLAYGLDNPFARVTLELVNGPRTLIIGAYDQESDSYVIQAENESMIVRVPGQAIVEFLVADQEMFLVAVE
ncbi:MAG: DUF4340 domain-containing protein [Chloroflexota bacterium]